MLACAYTHRKAAIENALNNRKNADQKSLETVFSISICRQSGDK